MNTSKGVARALVLGSLVLIFFPVPEEARPQSESEGCSLHWTEETDDEDWKEFWECADEEYERCDRQGELSMTRHGDHYDLHFKGSC